MPLLSKCVLYQNHHKSLNLLDPSQDSGTAKKLAYSREVHQRCITLQGDDFNPSGLLTGGSRANQASVLAGLHELAQAEAR